MQCSTGLGEALCFADALVEGAADCAGDDGAVVLDVAGAPPALTVGASTEAVGWCDRRAYAPRRYKTATSHTSTTNPSANRLVTRLVATRPCKHELGAGRDQAK
jgi:hypothetical protein